MAEIQKNILIVDDIPLNRELIKQLFCDNFGIFEAEDGAQAIEILKYNSDSIKAVFLDIIMPVIDGFGVLKDMNKRKLTEKIPVFLITVADDKDIINKGYDMGAVDIVNKPFNSNIIKRRVYNTIELFDHRFQMEKLLKKQTEKIKIQSDKLKKSSLSLIDTLSTVVEFRDCESGQHIQRIRSITKALLMEIVKTEPSYSFSVNTIENISIASAMHDIGKITTPDNILKKPGRLTHDEFEIMKLHTVKGCELLESIPDLREDDNYRYYYDICRWHHERWDGSGYPDGLKGNQIPIWSQVVALADCYDALVSVRVYKPAYSHDQAVEMILNGECGCFNPILMDIFTKISKILELPAEHGDLN